MKGSPPKVDFKPGTKVLVRGSRHHSPEPDFEAIVLRPLLGRKGPRMLEVWVRAFPGEKYRVAASRCLPLSLKLDPKARAGVEL